MQRVSSSQVYQMELGRLIKPQMRSSTFRPYYWALVKEDVQIEGLYINYEVCQHICLHCVRWVDEEDCK